MTERGEVNIFNRAIGTATGVEQQDTIMFLYTDFEPYDGFDMPAGEHLTVDYLNGSFRNYDTEGNITVDKDFFIVMFGFIARQKRMP